MSDGFDETLAELAALERRLARAIEGGLDEAAPGVEAEAQTTTAYTDRTGATRAGTVAYRAGDTARLGEALAQVQGKNPGRGLILDSAPIPDTERQLILTVPTDYVHWIELDGAAAEAFLAPALLTQAPRIVQAVAKAIAEELGR